MIEVMILPGIIVVVVGIVALLDWLARRKDRQSHAPRT